MLRENLKESRKRSKKTMANINRLNNIAKVANYITDLENIYASVVLPYFVDREPVIKALVLVENKKAAGQLDELYQIIAA